MASLLESVAEHEQGLLSQIESADAQAHKIVEEAHHDAALAVADATQKLETMIAQKRREAVEARARAEADIAAASDKRVADIRALAADKLDRVREELFRRVLPGGKQGE